MFRMSHTSFAGPGAGEQSPYWPYYTTKWVNMSSVPKDMRLGQYWELQGDAQSGGGNAFMLVKAASALEIGALVTQVGLSGSIHDEGTVTNSGSSATRIVLGSTAVTSADVGNILWIRDNAANAALDSTGGSTGAKDIASGNCLRVIKNYVSATTVDIAGRDINIPVATGTGASQSYMNDPDALVAAPTNSTQSCLIRPYNVVINPQYGVPCGIALGYCASGNYTIIQVAGLAIVSTEGTTDITQGALLVQGANNGQAVIATSGATPYMGACSIVALAAQPDAAGYLDPASGNHANKHFIPCYVNFFGNL